MEPTQGTTTAEHVISVDAVSTIVPKKIPCDNSRCSKRNLALAAGVAVLLVSALALAIALPLTLVSQGDAGGNSVVSYDPDDCQNRTGSICDISFGPDPLQTLDLYTTPAAAEGMRAPCVIYVHGGGWSTGDKSTNTNPPFWILDYRARGYHVASVNYRLAAPPANDKHPKQIEDVESAVVYLKRHAADYHLDPDKIVAIGNSAGGHLVSLLGTRNGPGSDPRVAGVVNLYGGATLHGPQSDHSGIINLLGCEGLGNTPNVPGTPCHEAALNASPDQYLAADNSPFLIFHGENDTVATYEGSVMFQAQLESVGANSTLVIVPGVGHDKDRVACAETGGLTNAEHIYRWIHATLTPGAPCGLDCVGGTIYGDGTFDISCLRAAAASTLD